MNAFISATRPRHSTPNNSLDCDSLTLAFVETAQIALIVSVVSACVTLGGLVWQFMLYRLSGSRLKVRLRPGFLDHQNTIYRGKGRSGLPANQHLFDGGISQFGVELALIQVTNIGRVAVSVEDVSLDLGRMTWWKLWRRSIAGIPVQAHEGHDKNSARLEPGASVTVIYPLWALVKGTKHAADRRSLTVRGTATPTGRRARLSPRRHSWRIPRNMNSLFPDFQLTPDVRAYRMLWHMTSEKDGRTPFARHWHKIRKSLSEGANELELDKLLEDLAPDSNAFMTAANVKAAYDGEDLAEWGIAQVY